MKKLMQGIAVAALVVASSSAFAVTTYTKMVRIGGPANGSHVLYAQYLCYAGTAGPMGDDICEFRGYIMGMNPDF